MLDAYTSDTFMDALVPLFAVLAVASVLVCIVLVVHARRAWRVQSATLQMQKDIAEIKDQLRKQARPPVVPEAQNSTQTHTDTA